MKAEAQSFQWRFKLEFNPPLLFLYSASLQCCFLCAHVPYFDILRSCTELDASQLCSTSQRQACNVFHSFAHSLIHRVFCFYFYIYFHPNIDKEVPKPGEARKKLQKFDTRSSITIVPTVDDDGMDYACEARHPAIPVDRPMRAVVKLSVLCKCQLTLKQKLLF